MSINLYISEPPTSGKVIFHTDFGELQVELWCNETPKACRNFIQLALEGFYDNTVFHRIVPNFCIQGGDPSGTGQGGDSIYNDFFQSEFHSRLRFNRRGLLGMVSVGEDKNLSQFFFTLEKATELNQKNTLFGKIVGDTIFNLIRMSEIEIEDERPVYPPKLLRIEVIEHPFEDIVIRENTEKQVKEKKTKKVVKNKSLLSFVDEEGEEEQNTYKGKSYFDMVETQGQGAKEYRKAEKIKEKEVKEPPKTINESTPAEEERRSAVQIEIDKVKRDIRKIDRKTKKIEIEPKRSLLEQERENHLKGKRVIMGKRKNENETDVIAMLNIFKKKLVKAPSIEDSDEQENSKVCKLHSLENCKSCALMEEQDQLEEGWMAHKLKFPKEYGYKRDDPDELMVIDPRKHNK